MAPTTTVTTVPATADGELGWFRTNPTLTLTADDGPLGSIDKIRYRLDGGETQEYTGAIPVSGPGNHEIEYWATDKAEEPNTEQVKRYAFRIDDTAPMTEATIQGDTSDGGAVDVVLDATDGDLGSGVVLTEYRVDGGPWTTYASKDEQIFDGTGASLAQWRQAPSGRFDLMTDGSGGITPVGGLGMLWYPVKPYGDFRLKLQFREGRTDGGYSNGGVFVRFPDPRVPTAQRPDECARTGSAATQEAWVAIYCGHEIQLYDGNVPNDEPRKTGSIYTFDNNDITQIGQRKETGEWEDYEVEVVGQRYRIYRNGDLINEYMNTPDKKSDRGDPDASKRQFARGYIGLQNHGGADTIQYRDIRVENLTPGAMGTNPTGMFTVEGDGPHTVDVRSTDAAGNVEERTTYEFEIGLQVPPDSVDDDPTPLPLTPTQPPGAVLPTFIDTPASYRLGTMPTRISRATLTRRGLSVPVTCTGAMTGSATLTLSASDARKLKLSRRTIDAGDVRCWGPHTARITLKPSKALSRQLARKGGPRSVKLTLSVQMRDWGKPAQTERKTITLRR